MGQYIGLPGVKTWYETEGEGDPLLLLHGGFGTNEMWGLQRSTLAAKYQVFLPERRGHGHTPDVEGAISYQAMANDTIEFIETVVRRRAHLVGWSDGGIVALMVAISRPDLVEKLVAIGANFLPASQSGAAPEMLDHMSADSPDMAMFRTMYEAASPDGPEHWPIVFEKIVAMYAVEPNLSVDDLARIGARTLVMVGDDDLLTFEHTLALYQAVPSAELAVVPGTSHAVLMEKPDLANAIILDFLGNEPVPTMIPIRRAATSHGT